MGEGAVAESDVLIYRIENRSCQFWHRARFAGSLGTQFVLPLIVACLARATVSFNGRVVQPLRTCSWVQGPDSFSTPQPLDTPTPSPSPPLSPRRPTQPPQRDARHNHHSGARQHTCEPHLTGLLGTVRRRWRRDFLHRWFGQQRNERYSPASRHSSRRFTPESTPDSHAGSQGDSMSSRQVSPMETGVQEPYGGRDSRRTSRSDSRRSSRKMSAELDPDTAYKRAAATHVTSILLGSSAAHKHEPAHPFSAQRASPQALSSHDSFKVVTNAVVREVDDGYDLSFPDMVVSHCQGGGSEHASGCTVLGQQPIVDTPQRSR